MFTKEVITAAVLTAVLTVGGIYLFRKQLLTA